MLVPYRGTETTPTTSSRVATSHNSATEDCTEMRRSEMHWHGAACFPWSPKVTERPDGTTEHLKGVRTLRSSWVPGTLRAQLAKPVGCPSVQTLCSDPLCQTTCSKILAQTGDAIVTVKSKQGIMLQENVTKEFPCQPLFIKFCIYCSQTHKKRKGPTYS